MKLYGCCESQLVTLLSYTPTSVLCRHSICTCCYIFSSWFRVCFRLRLLYVSVFLAFCLIIRILCGCVFIAHLWMLAFNRHRTAAHGRSLECDRACARTRWIFKHLHSEAKPILCEWPVTKSNNLRQTWYGLDLVPLSSVRTLDAVTIDVARCGCVLESSMHILPLCPWHLNKNFIATAPAKFEMEPRCVLYARSFAVRSLFFLVVCTMEFSLEIHEEYG